MNAARIRLPFLALLLTLPAAQTPKPEEQESAGFVRFEFKEPRVLRLDPLRFAVYDERALLPGLMPAEAASLEALGIPGWSLIRLAEAADEGSIRGRLTELTGRLDGAFVTPVFVDDLGGPLLVTREILVQFEPTIAAEQAEALLASAGAGTILERDWAGLPRAYRLRCSQRNGLDVLATANALAQRSEVRFAEPDLVFTGRGEQAAAGDPGFVWSWGLHGTGAGYYDADFDIGALEAWSVTSGNPAVRVLILDVGVDPVHPDLNQDPGADFTGEGGGGAPVNPCDNHGTPMAGCVAAIAGNGLGSSGIAPGCKVVSARVFIANYPACTGGWTTQTSWTPNALAWAVTQGIRITSNSNVYGSGSSALTTMYQQTRDVDGVIHFASAGNAGSSTIAYPARLPSVNAIGALGFVGRRAIFSNTGPELDFMAPGVEILTTDRSGAAGALAGDYNFSTGTSPACPLAAGVAALLRSFRPNSTPDFLEHVLRISARDFETPGRDDLTGWGLVRASRAVEIVAQHPYARFDSRLPKERFRSCDFPSFSADRSWVAFASVSRELVAGDDNGKRDIFVRDLLAGSTQRVSVASSGAQADNDSRRPVLSANGRFVAFESWAGNLVTGDTNGRRDVFLRDTLAGTTVRVSVATSGAQAIGESMHAAISADGRWVAFQSSATNFHPAATSGAFQVYVRDMLLSTTTLVSQLGGVAGNGNSQRSSLSADGQVVAFDTEATNLLPLDVNGSNGDVLVHLLGSASFELASVDGALMQGSGWSGMPVISGDGRTVAFATLNEFDPAHAGSPSLYDVYVRDLVAGTTRAGGTDSTGMFGVQDTLPGALSANGRFLAFLGASPAFVAGDTNGEVDVFRKDLWTGAVIRVSVGAAGQEALTGSGHPWISPDGDRIGFTCGDDTLTPGDHLDGDSDIYVRDVSSGRTQLVTRGS